MSHGCDPFNQQKARSNVNWGSEQKINKRGTDITLDTSLKHMSSISPSS